MINDRLIADVGKSIGRDLPAEIAIDASRVDEKIAEDISWVCDFK